MGKRAERYSDIIDLPHHRSVRRPQMPLYHRAAQFAPFAALVGYDEMVQETAEAVLQDRSMGNREKVPAGDLDKGMWRGEM